MWEHCVTDDREAIRSKLDREVDWVIKHQLIEAYRAKHDLPLGHPKVALMDLQYHDVNRERSLFYKLQDRGMVERMCTDADIDDAIDNPPQTTRARLRGEFIRRAKERKRDYTVDWVHLKLNDQAQRTVLCKDPFKSRDERVEKLIASLCSVPTVPSFATRRSPTVTSAERPGCSGSSSTTARRAYVLTAADRSGGGRRPGRGQHHRRRARARHRRLARRALEPRAATRGDAPGGGHIMKLRYTSLQVDTGAAEERPPRASTGRSDLDGLPVVVCGLHSQVACVAAVRRGPSQPGARASPT